MIRVKYRGREFYTGMEEEPDGLFVDSTRKSHAFFLGYLESDCVFTIDGLKAKVDHDFDRASSSNLPFPMYYLCGYDLFYKDGDSIDLISSDKDGLDFKKYIIILKALRECSELNLAETEEFVSLVNDSKYKIEREFPAGFKVFKCEEDGDEWFVVIPWNEQD